MSHQYLLHYPPSTDPHGDRRSSIFTTPITIEIGDEGSEFLEAKIREKVCLYPLLPSMPSDPLPIDRRGRKSRHSLDASLWRTLHRRLCCRRLHVRESSIQIHCSSFPPILEAEDLFHLRRNVFKF